MARLFEEDDLFDFEDDRFLPKLEKLFGDQDLTSGQRPCKVSSAPDQRGFALSPTQADATE